VIAHTSSKSTEGTFKTFILKVKSIVTYCGDVISLENFTQSTIAAVLSGI